MNYEIISYSLIFLAAILMSIVENKGIVPKIIISALLFGYSLAVRYSGFDSDFIVYEKVLDYDSLDSFYYYREPIYWFGSYFLYNSLGLSKEIVFFVIDLFSFSLIAKSVSNFKLPKWCLLAIVAVFPMFLGIQNVYRQYISICFLLLASSYVKTDTLKCALLITLSGLSHNVGFLFYPIIFCGMENTNRNKFILLSSLMFASLAVPLAASSKSVSESGFSLGFVYIFLIIISVSVIKFSYALSNQNQLLTRDVSCTLFVIVYMSFLSIITLGDNQGERVCMVAIILVIPHVFIAIKDCYKNQIVINSLSICVLSIPTFIISSASNFFYYQG